MLLLIAGVLLWSVAHLFKRVAPAPRAALGGLGKGIVAVAVVGSVVLMVMGHQAWVLTPDNVFWGRHPATTGINNLLMLVAVYFFAASVGKTWITGKVRHPQLTAVKTWALAHLLVNGDAPSFVLFGGLLAWAVISVILIGKQDGKPALSVQTSLLREGLTGVATVLVFGAISFAHVHLGYPVFG